MRRLLLLAAALAAPSLGQAATLKAYGMVAGSVVRLSDLWDGVHDDKTLGPAPAPGARITVAAPQLAAIARQFAVDWRPNSTADRIVLERSGRALSRDEVKPALRTALLGAGASAEADIELAGFTAPLLPHEGKPEMSVAQVELDQLSGRFSALLDVALDDAPNTQVRLTGRIQEMVEVPVSRRRILPGDVVGATDLEWARVPRATARGEIIHAPADAVGLAAKQTIAANQPIQAADLGRPVLVKKGDKMNLTLESPGIALVARGTALDPGGRGEQIRVLNEYSRMTVDAEITAPGEARIVPGTARPANRFATSR